MGVLTACSREMDSGSGPHDPERAVQADKKTYPAEEGIKRALLKLEASLNHRNLEGYLSVFSGEALEAVSKGLTVERLRKITGKFRLKSFRIVRRYGEDPGSPAGVSYEFENSQSTGRVTGKTDRAIFGPLSGRDHWVIISVVP
jgi:hypothetical protein